MLEATKRLSIGVLPALLAACASQQPGDAAAPADARGDTASEASSTDATATDVSAEDTATLDAVAADSGDPFAGIDRTRPASCARGSWAVGVAGRIVDEAGAPIAGALAQFCLKTAGASTAACLAPTAVDASGAFAAVIPASLRCLENGMFRILAPRAPYATTYCRTDLAEVTDAILSPAEPFVLFGTMAATTLPPVGDPTASRTVEFAESGVSIDVRPMDLFGAEYALLGARNLARRDTCLLANAPAMLGVFGISPESDVLHGGFAVRVANATGLAPGTPVVFYVLGGLNTRTAAGVDVAEGEWGVAGTGRVSSDGARVETDVGGEITYLSYFGYAAAQ